MQPRLSKVAPVALFFALLLLPTIASIPGFPKVPPLEEYRKLAERPHLHELWTPPRAPFLDVTRRFDLWFSDQFSTRALWVRLYTQTLYSLFHESDQVHIGKQGWLYYRSVIDTESPGMEVLIPKIPEEVDQLGKLTVMLKQRGITLYLLPMGMKEQYYPEFVPSSVSYARHFKYYDAFMDRAAADRRLNLVDMRAQLKAAKQGGLKIWHQTDFHWTDPAGGLAAHRILDALGAQEGKPELARSFHYDITPMPDLSGGQARFLPLFKVPKENSVGVKPVSPTTTYDYQYGKDGIELQGVATPGQPARFQPMLIYGDSYFDALNRAGFLYMFQSFVRARVNDNDLVNAYRHRQPGTRYMLLEYIYVNQPGIDRSAQALIGALEKDPSL